MLTFSGSVFMFFILSIGCNIYDKDRLNSKVDSVAREPGERDAKSDVDKPYIDGDNDHAETENASMGNICKAAYDLKLETIKEKCEELNDCCYCDCEILDDPDCDCMVYFLLRNTDYTECKNEDYKSAKQCIDSPDVCASAVRNATISTCAK